MIHYIIRRLLWACVLFIAVTIVTYVIFYAIPADPARLACGQRATPECVKRAAHYLGTDRPLVEGRHRDDLGQAFEPGCAQFDLVKQVVVNDVLGQQGFRDLHVGTVIRPATL